MKVLIVASKENERAGEAAERLSGRLGERGARCRIVDLEEMPSSSETCSGEIPLMREERLDTDFDLIAVLGGDGSVLRAMRLSLLLDVPVLGINYGHLGFLCSSSQMESDQLVLSALNGELETEELPVLELYAICRKPAHKAGNTYYVEHPFRMMAFNDVALSRIPSGSPLKYGLTISGQDVGTFKGDGIIVSTSTGSTAYALSAGGPLVAPGNKGLVVVPAATMTPASRPIVTSENDWVEITLSRLGRGGNAVLLVDGEPEILESNISSLLVRRGSRTVKLFRSGGGFYRRVSKVFIAG